MLLEAQDLTVKYGEIVALQNVTLGVPTGKIVSVIGANGGGKTTLIKAIVGLLPFEGRVRFSGEDISSLKCHQRVAKGMSLVPEGRRVFPALSVAENLLAGAYTQRKNRQQVSEDFEASLEMFPALRPRLEQKAGSLSGGEQQMVAISRALMSRPKLLMLDEPAMGLAPIIIQTLREVILRIRDKGTTVLLVEQNASLALGVSDYGYLLQVGHVVLEGTAEELMSDERVKRAYFGG